VWTVKRAYVLTASNTLKPAASMSGTMLVSRKPAFSKERDFPLLLLSGYIFRPSK
jgi:hypothetical protein